MISVVKVFLKDQSASFHAVSFCKLENGLIAEMDEYWADDGAPPEWRQKLGFGTVIR